MGWSLMAQFTNFLRTEAGMRASSDACSTRSAADARIAVAMLRAEQPQSIPDHPSGSTIALRARTPPGARRRGNAEPTRNSKEVKADKKNQKVKCRIGSRYFFGLPGDGMTSIGLRASLDFETPCSTGTTLGQLGDHLLVESVPMLPSSEKAIVRHRGIRRNHNCG